jgi:putrescine aminotransferase
MSAKVEALHHLRPFADPREIEARGALVMARGDGVFVESTDGRRFLDGMAGLWCVQVGYGRAELVDAARAQLERLPFYNTFFGTTTEPLVELVEALRSRTPGALDWFVFGNSGSEAIDTAVRLVRHYWAAKGQSGRRHVIGRTLGYHGSTLAAASVGGMAGMHAQGGLPLDGFHHVMPPYPFEYARQGESADHFGRRAADAIDQKIRELGAERVAAVFAEPVMGAGGVIVPPDSYWPAVQEICRRHDVLLLADEVICGFGRTGPFWGCERYGIEPDLLTMAKGLTSGYVPMSALAIGPRVAEVLREGGVLQHGFTYSGHPTAAAVALANLRVLEAGGVLENAARVGPHLQQGLRALAALPIVGEARGVGMLGALDLVRPGTTRERFAPSGTIGKQAFRLCLEEGLIVRSLREGVAVCPPLCITEDEVDLLLERLRSALVRLAQETA